MNEFDLAASGPSRIWNANFIFIMLANCFVVNSYLSMTPIFPIYLEQLGYAQDIAGIVTGIFVVTAMISRPFAGKVLDSGHRRDTYLAGQLISIAAILLYAFASSALMLSLLRLLHGIGIGIVTTAANTIAVDFIPKNRITEGIGYFGLGTVASMAIAPSLGLYLIDKWDFNVMFFTAAGMCAIGSLLALLVRYEKRTDDIRVVEALKGGIHLIERAAVKPAVVGCFSGMTFGVTSGFIAVYGLERRVEHIGLFFTVFALVLVMSRPAAGRLADRKGFGYAIIPGIIFQMLSMVLLFFADSLLMFLMSAFVLGIGSGATQSTLNSMAVHKVPPQRRGAAISTFYLGLDLAAGLGPMLGGIAASYVGYSMMYLLTVVPLTIALLLFIMAGRKSTEKKGIQANG
ncbi:MFS transporter [Paenibacillus fonticola]|uniref:MFS transporter n=1 Tax=Paenibacillus fonticola TaxID=379896 RepID=UPI00037E0014|nr:MFS transporter [Paenibacillus fonticola]